MANNPIQCKTLDEELILTTKINKTEEYSDFIIIGLATRKLCPSPKESSFKTANDDPRASDAPWTRQVSRVQNNNVNKTTIIIIIVLQ